MPVKTSRQLTPKRFIYDQQAVVGYGCDELSVATIPSCQARTIIVAKHYSHKLVNNSYLQLGVFAGRELVGVMQFGYAMNPNSGSNVVTGTANREYMELKRMWLHDSQPRNSESRVISYALKLIKRLHPSVRWLQSFADERCGCFGVVYQAANFAYIGSHVTDFYELGGAYYHRIAMTALGRREGGTGKVLRQNIEQVRCLKLRQYRYIFFIDKRARGQLNAKRFKIQPYPKPVNDS